VGAVSSSCSNSKLLVCWKGYLRVYPIEKSRLGGRVIHECVGGKARTALARGDYPFKVPPFIGIDATEPEAGAILLKPESARSIPWVIHINGQALRMMRVLWR
jgi:hypothetical protein